MIKQKRFHLLIAAIILPTTAANADTILDFGIGEMSTDAVCATDAYYATDDGPCHICYSTENSYLGEECPAGDRDCIINSVIEHNSCQDLVCNQRRTSEWVIHYDGEVANTWNYSGHYTCTSTESWFYEDGPISTCDSTNCQSTNWTASNPGYQKRTYRYCSNSITCESETQYRCASYYYGSSTNGTTGCTRCPDSPDNYAEWEDSWGDSGLKEAGQTTGPGKTSKNSCYIGGGSDGSYFFNESGMYQFTSDCYWS